MSIQMVTLELPAKVYEDLQALAQARQKAPDEVIVQLVRTARQQTAWNDKLAALRQQIAQDGGLNVGATRDEVVDALRRTRHEIFEAEYAHLYR
ncbi:MAG: hypothetical protein KKD28_03545 [Chloroflexi bacterium]|nr:hypothetical protein [Chloroflexota bacterium]MBU1660529.1 hypothetical protein [Chloroflexota bacterium]